MQLQWRIFRSCFSLWLCLMTGALLPSAVMAYSVQVLSSRSGGAYDEVIDALRSETLRGIELRVQYLNTNEPSWKLLESTNLVVAIGVDAANTAIQTADPGTPILCVLIPKVAFEALTGGKKENRKVTAIFLDPPLAGSSNSFVSCYRRPKESAPFWAMCPSKKRSLFELLRATKAFSCRQNWLSEILNSTQFSNQSWPKQMFSWRYPILLSLTQPLHKMS